jgi:hypothetical protein
VSGPVRLNCGLDDPMIPHFRPFWRLAGDLAAGGRRGGADADAASPQARPARHGANHRLILKDGTYQMCASTRLWATGCATSRSSAAANGKSCPWTWWTGRPRASGSGTTPHHDPEEDASPAMKEAEEIDKEEAAERDEQKARMPEVAKGLELPDEDGVFALDTFEGTPELVELLPTELNAKRQDQARPEHAESAGRAKGQPGTRRRARQGSSARERSGHLSLAWTPATRRAGRLPRHDGEHRRRQGSGQPQAWRAFGHFGLRHCARGRARALRIVGAIHMSPTGTVTQDEDVIPAKVEVLPGKHWLKITPRSRCSSASMRWWRSSPPPTSTSRSGTSAWTRSWATTPGRWGR